MIVNGTEANTLLSAQIASTQRQPAQDTAAAAQRDRTLDTQRIAQERAAEAPQTAAGVSAVDTDESGDPREARPDLPRDAQADAREVQERSNGRPSGRGGAVDLFV